MSRTRLGIKSSFILAIEAILIGVLTIARTKSIIDTFGTNVNAIVQLAVQFSAYLLLFESGMTAAYQYNMYRPLIDKNYKKISALYNGLKFNMKTITINMFILGVIISIIYPYMLTEKGISYINVVSILIVMSLRIICPYILTLPMRTLLIVKEKKYITDIIECVKNTVTIITEIVLIKYTKLPLAFILLVYIFYTALTRGIYIKLVNINYNGKIDKFENKDMTPKNMTNDILVHKIASLITSNTDSVLLSMFSTLNNVTIYTSYYTLISYPITLLTRMIDSIRASIALKVNEDTEKSFSIFKEMISLELFCFGIVVPVFIIMVNPFVDLWIGREFRMGYIDIILMSFIALHRMIIPTIYATRDAKGLYKESKNFSLVQAIVNMILSLLLIKPFGITGILIGTCIADFCILQPKNYSLIYSKIFNRKIDIYYNIIVSIALCVLSTIISLISLKLLSFDISNLWLSFVYETIICLFISTIVNFIGLYILDKYFRCLIQRFNILGKKAILIK